MSRMGSYISATAAAAAALLVAGAAHAEVTLTAITSLITVNPLSQSFLENYQKPVNAQCKGQAQVRYVGGPEVSPPRNVHMAIQRGQFDMLHGPASYYIGAFPEAYGMLGSTAPIQELHKNGGFDLLDSQFQKKVGAKLVAWGESPGYYTYLVDKPKLDQHGVPDLKGIRMRATGTYRPLFEALGASTVQMTESEIYTGIERGVVRGFGWPTTGVPALGLHKITKYAVKPEYYTTNTTVTVNLGKWNSLTQAQRDCLNQVARAYESKANAFMEKERVKDEKAMLDGGVEFIELKGAAAERYLKIANDAIWAEYEKRVTEGAAELRSKLYPK